MNHRRLPSRLEAPPPEEDLFGWQALLHWAGFVLRAPLRHRALALSAFALVLGIGCAASVIIPVRYQVQTTLLAGYRQANALSLSTDGGPDTPTRAARDLLLRRDNLRSILERTNFVEQYLGRRPWAIRTKDRVFELFRGKPRTGEEIVEGLLDALEGRLWVDVRSEGTLAITLQWWDPELARQIVDAAQQSFLEARHASEVQAIDDAIQILETQRIRLEEDIRVNIEALERKQEQLRISAPRRPATVSRPREPDPEAGRLERELAFQRNSLAEMEGVRRQRSAELQAELAQQRTIYAADHPTIARTRRALESLSTPAPRAIELAEEISGLERELAKRAGETSPRGTAAPFLDARLRLDYEDPRLDFERGLLDNLLRQHADLRNRIQDVQVERETAEAAFVRRYHVVSPAQLPRGPVKPYPLIIFVGSVLGGIAFALFAAVAADLRSGRVIEQWQIEDRLDLPVLAEIRK